MRPLVLVFLGAGTGGTLRYLAGLGAARWTGGGWPWATLAVNVLGSFLLGALLASRVGGDSSRLLLGTGLLGGFTTFSAFSLEAVTLLRTSPGAGLAYVGASVALSLMAAGLGLALGRA